MTFNCKKEISSLGKNFLQIVVQKSKSTCNESSLREEEKCLLFGADSIKGFILNVLNLVDNVKTFVL